MALPKLVEFKIPGVSDADMKDITEISNKVMMILKSDPEFKDSELGKLLPTLDFFYKDREELKQKIGQISEHTRNLIIKIVEGKLNNPLYMDEFMEVCVLNRFKNDKNFPFDCSKKLPDLFKNLKTILDDYGGVEHVAEKLSKAKDLLIKELVTEEGVPLEEAKKDVVEEKNVTISLGKKSKKKQRNGRNGRNGRNRRMKRRMARRMSCKPGNKNKYTGFITTLSSIWLTLPIAIFFPPVGAALIATTVVIDLFIAAKSATRPGGNY